MPVRLEADRLHLEEDCGAEDALALMESLRAEPKAAIDMGACRSVHSAVLQCLLAAGRPILAPPSDPLLAAFVLPLLAGAEARAAR